MVHYMEMEARQNLKKPEIAEAIQQRMEKRSERTQLTADEVVLQLARMDDAGNSYMTQIYMELLLSARSLLAVTALRLATMRGGVARSSRKAPKVQIYTLPVKTKARFLALLLRRGDRRPGGIVV